MDGHISVVISIVIALDVDDHKDCKLLLLYHLVCVCGNRDGIAKRDSFAPEASAVKLSFSGFTVFFFFFNP